MKLNTPFNKPYLSGNELVYIKDAIGSGKISGNGKYTKYCHNFFKDKYNFDNCLLTSSCTDALEMAAILINIKPGDEVIIPSYTFVSTANAFVLRGAKIVFADSSQDHPGIDEDLIEQLITPMTKAIVPVHYAGCACNMEKIMTIANKYKIWVIEDAAQAIDSYFINSNGQKKPLGSIGHLAAFSFHETKNIISGEGGMLVVNDESLKDRAEIIWEKGTNRSSFFRGEVDKYGWVDIGSSYLPSEITAAFLWAQLEDLDQIQTNRNNIWSYYYNNLKDYAILNNIKLPYIPIYATNNSHMFYMICPNINFRNQFIAYLKSKNIHSVFHYQSLHLSPYYRHKHDGRDLNKSDLYTDCLVRLPIWLGLNSELVVTEILNFKPL
jgi:dTDP-4-amino-4,6-dideoxygalactose transaminase